MNFDIRPITLSDTQQIAQWQYADEYTVYSFDREQSAENISYFLDPANHIFAIDDDAGLLAAYCSFGDDGRVPGGDYDADALDIGIGMRPNLTGQGYGTGLTEAIVTFAVTTFRPKLLRVTIAAFNKRAQRVVENNGFHAISRFHNPNGDPFTIYVRDLSTPV
ncbi:MAG: GNAT family N-acetyltransferase [Anaerolineae bacterium]|nr:GNAT family N-acetyltransferase [Anaerolineae bacterium]